MSETKITRFAILEDDPVMAAGIQAVLSGIANSEIAFKAKSQEELEIHLQINSIDILFMDVIIHGSTGLDAFYFMEKHYPTIKRIVFSSVTSLTIVKALYHTGIYSFIHKNSESLEILRAVVHAMNDLKYVQEEHKPFIKSPEVHSLKISDREKEILSQIIKGRNSKDIATTLCLTVSTVEFHRRNLLNKFEVQNVAELVRVATQFGVY